ncbi:MAG: type II toxin-antitoxin system VapC family toxin [Mesorhizobium sp.]|nr:type II toxin-antitoxin system VapC family toxin [Mesorhizobium sp.]
MILLDSSVWMDHLRAKVEPVTMLLERNQIAIHPFVVTEIALGSIANRARVLWLLQKLPGVPKARDDEVLDLIDRERLFGSGIGFVDAHLLASARLAGIPLWTMDKKLNTAAERLGVAFAAKLH